MSVTVSGGGTLAQVLRDGVHSDTRSAVIVVDLDGEKSISSLAELTDAHIDEIYEQPMQRVIAALQEAHTTNCERIVVVVPTTGMSGGACYAPQAALAESARILVKSAARQWGASGITVNAVANGIIDTDMTRVLPEDQRQALATGIPLARLGDPQDIAMAVLYLVAPSGAYVTGQTLHVNGGMYMP